LIDALAWVTAICAIIGVIQQIIGTWLVRRFARQPITELTDPPPVSVLKPLCGVEPLTEISGA
jgi:ceramide glucosyltransferase